MAHILQAKDSKKKKASPAPQKDTGASADSAPLESLQLKADQSGSGGSLEQHNASPLAGDRVVQMAATQELEELRKKKKVTNNPFLLEDRKKNAPAAAPEVAPAEIAPAEVAAPEVVTPEVVAPEMEASPDAEPAKKGWGDWLKDKASAGYSTVKDKASAGYSAAKDKVNEKIEYAKENKAEVGIKAAEFTAKRIASLADAAPGVGDVITGTKNLATGGLHAYQSMDTLSKIKNVQNGEEKLSEEDQIALGIEKRLQKDKLAKSAGEGLSGGLKVAAGAATLSGVGAPVGAALGGAAMAVSGVSSLTGKAVQSSRDKEARRLRSRDKIVDDKIKKNKARDETITGGAWYNPMNWGAKLSRASGFESEDQKLGLDGHEDQVSRDRYLASKEQKYGNEGWDRDEIDQGKAAKTSTNWFESMKAGAWKTQTKDYGKVDIGIAQGLSTEGLKEEKETKSRQAAMERLGVKEKKKEKKGWFW
jgi:hypothetical protein